MGCKKCSSKTAGLTKNSLVLLFFLISIIAGVIIPVLVFIWSRPYYAYWKPVYTLNVLFFTNCGWLVVLSTIGCFLLFAKATNKLIATAYTLGLFSCIVGFVICLIMSQLADPNLRIDDNVIVQNLKDYYADNEDIPGWMHTVQHEMKCCGFLGPSDWKLLIYPTDKPAIEDVPDSCCIVQAVGCNLIVGELRNNTKLGKWIYTNGCRKHIEEVLASAMEYLFHGLIPCITMELVVLVLYWYQVNCFLTELNTAKKGEGQCQDEAEDTGTTPNTPEPEEQEIVEETPRKPFGPKRNNLEKVQPESLRISRSPRRAAAFFEDDYVVPRKTNVKPRKADSPKGRRVSFDDDLDD